MNITVEKIKNKIANRACDLADLIEKVRMLTGANGTVKVGNWKLVSEFRKSSGPARSENCVFAQTWREDAESESGGYWETRMISAPFSRSHECHSWTYECLADKWWDHSSTDFETLENLKSAFDAEERDMKIIEDLADKFVAKIKSVIDFFS